MRKEFLTLVGEELSVVDLSNKLYKIGGEFVDDICDYGNWSEILECGNVVVATDECGEEHIKIDFEIAFESGEDEMIEATYIKIINIEEF